MFVVFSPTYRPKAHAHHDDDVSASTFVVHFGNRVGCARTALPFLISSTTPPSPVSAAPLLVLSHRLPRATLYVRAAGTDLSFCRVVF